MRQETFFNYRSYRWMWLALLSLIVTFLIYVWHDPIGGARGSTWLGYTYGILSALGMCILMWYGLRKRSYFSSNTSLKGSLALHIWLGCLLIILVPLHAGFSFGLNIHTLAYVLMLLAIATGIWGAICYFNLAPEIGSHRGRGSLKQLLEQYYVISDAADALTLRKSAEFLKLARKLDFSFEPTIKSCIFSKDIPALNQWDLAQDTANFQANEQSEVVKFVGIVSRKIELSNLIRSEVLVQFWLKVWLYFHVPLATAAFAAMLVHIIVEFFYW